MSVQFLESVFLESLKHPNFFNGRVLTATDLRDEQVAHARRGRYVGQAAGEGVVYGLNVTKTNSGNALEITGGLAICRSGDALHLPGQSTTVELVIQTPLEVATDSPFAVCAPAGAVTLTGVVPTGFYLLALTSAARLSPELAAHSGLNGGAAPCINRYEEIGVQFKLIPLTNADLIAPIGETSALRRSQLAHVCFGTDELAAVHANPLSVPAQYGLLDRLRDDRLTDCDVPLAVFQFRGVVDFVDVWSVRRPCLPGMRPDIFPGNYSATLNEVFTQFAGSRRVGEAIAFLLQFQKQLEDIRADGSIDPLNAAAASHFEYLPAAGYLPISTSAAPARRFRIPNFFGHDIVPTELDPAYLRSVLHESFYVEPILVSSIDVDVFTVPGASADNPYMIFVRRLPQAVVVEPPEVEPDPDEPEVERTGNLQVIVLDEDGDPVPSVYIEAVRATNISTRQVFPGRPKGIKQVVGSGYREQQFEGWFRESRENTRAKYEIVPKTGAKDTAKKKIDQAVVYLFNDLPAGEYTVAASSARVDKLSVSKAVTIHSGAVEQVALTIRSMTITKPGKPELDIPSDTELPWGVLIDKYFFDKRWEKIWPPDKSGLPHDPGYIDPLPDDWYRVNDLYLRAMLEELLGGIEGGVDPVVATDDAEVYIRNGYDPATPSDLADAFVQTKDGTRYPLVVVAVDNTLDKSVAVIRTEIADFDTATFNQLDAYGLGSLETVASAPAGLVSAVLGQSEGYADSLIEDSRTTLADDFQNGFMGYPGVSKAVSKALKDEYGDKVGLANAAPEAIAATIGSIKGGDAAAWANFTGRFLADVQANVPLGSFDIGTATGIGADGREALSEIGIHTNQELLDAAGNQAGRAALKGALEVNDATLDRYAADALLNIAQGQFLTAPEKSVATLEGVAPELATELAGKGVYSARDLANSNPEMLAQGSGFSAAELQPLVETATTYSHGYSTLIKGVTNGAVDGERMTGAGFLSVGSIANADRAELEQIDGMTPETAALLNNLSGEFMNAVRGGGHF